MRNQGLMKLIDLIKKSKNLSTSQKAEKILTAIETNTLDGKDLGLSNNTKNYLLKILQNEYHDHLNFLQGIQ